MRVEIIDRDVFGSTKPLALNRYLVVNGWSEVRRIDGELAILGKTNRQGKTQLVWMPFSDQYTDYVSMVARLIKTVAEVEDKSELELLDDLETIAVGDLISVRSYDPLDMHDHTLPLADGADLLTRARMMAWAAASSAMSKRPVHSRHPSFEVSQFVRSLRLAQTERGSYIVKIVAPIPEPQKQPEGQFSGMPEAQPFARRAVIELVRGLNALHQAALDNKDRGKFFFNSFLSAVTSGVSANLCEALISSGDEISSSRPIEVSVTWSYAVAQTNVLPSFPVKFDSTVMPFIRQAAREFRAKNPEIITLNGWVNILERDAQSGGAGLIRLYARIDGKMKAIRMGLDPETYDLAIDAHKNGSLVSVTGTLVVENGVYYRLQNPTGFYVIEQEAFSDRDEENNDRFNVSSS